MGTDIWATITVGEPVEAKQATKTITKFNENTGTPYSKEITFFEWFFISDDKLCECDEDDYIIMKHGDEEYGSALVYGITIVETASHRSSVDPVEVPLDKIEEAKKTYREMTNREPKVYISLDVSC